MSQEQKQISARSSASNWKSRVYVMGTALGALAGMISAYLFARAAEESSDHPDKRPDPIPTSQLLGVILALVTLARQIAEMGKPKNRKK